METSTKISNAVKWIEALKSSEFNGKKGLYQLGKDVGTPYEKFCCLGVGCKILNIETSWAAGYNSLFARSVGLNNSGGKFNETLDSMYSSLIGLNDGKFKDDSNFDSIVESIVSNFHNLFEPEVADGLKLHYENEAKFDLMAANAIKWIDGLKYYKKCTGRLRNNIDAREGPRYCCLGAACKILNVELTKGYRDPWFNASEPKLVPLVGLRNAYGDFYDASTSLISLNDFKYQFDKGFKNIRKEIFANLQQIFIDEVAIRLKKHYS